MENKRVTYLIKDLNHEIIRYICIADIDKQKMPTPAQMQILHFIISNNKKPIYQKEGTQMLTFGYLLYYGCLFYRLTLRIFNTSSCEPS